MPCISSALVPSLSGKLLLISSDSEDLCWHPSHIPILLPVVFIRQHTCDRSPLLSDRNAFPKSIPTWVKQLNVPWVPGDCFSKWNCSLQDYEAVRSTNALNTGFKLSTSVTAAPQHACWCYKNQMLEAERIFVVLDNLCLNLDFVLVFHVNGASERRLQDHVQNAKRNWAESCGWSNDWSPY